MYRSSGIDHILKTNRSLKQNSTEDYDLSEAELNILGYKILYRDRKPADAIKVFTLTTEEYPASSNAFDSLAEAYQVSGHAKAAKATYEKAFALDPTNEHSRTALIQLRRSRQYRVGQCLRMGLDFDVKPATGKLPKAGVLSELATIRPELTRRYGI